MPVLSLHFAREIGVMITRQRLTLPGIQFSRFVLLVGMALFLSHLSETYAQPSQQSVSELRNDHNEASQSTDELLSQIESLQHQVAAIEAIVKSQGVDTASMKSHGDKMRMSKSMGSLLTQQPANPPMSSTGSNQMQGMMAGMMNMMNSMMSGMGGMPGATSMAPPPGIGLQGALSSLPGFPGASHLYHIGATNFFLDHPEHLILTLDQQTRLSEIRTKALMTRADYNRKIQLEEENIWILTASDRPDLKLIADKIRVVEKLRGDQRVAFIEDVGKAASQLTEIQIKALIGDTKRADANAAK